MGAGLPAIAVCLCKIGWLTCRYRRQARYHSGSAPISGRLTNDRNLTRSHKFCAILANRAAYCIELDSHKRFAA